MTTTKKDPEVVNTKKEQEVVTTKKEPEVVNTKKEQEVTATKKEPEVTTTKKEPEVTRDLWPLTLTRKRPTSTTIIAFKLVSGISNISAGYAGFRLTCRSPLCRYAAWSSLAVSELQLSAATPLLLFTERQSLPSWIEFNCLRSAAVGKAARLSINWLDAACRLVIPCGKWRLRSWTDIIIKAAMPQAAS